MVDFDVTKAEILCDGAVVHTMDQGSVDWYEKKCGLMSASNASKLITPSGRPSASATAYIAQLVAERVLGFNEAELDDMAQTFWMERGTELEDRARAAFEMDTGTKVHICGGIERNGLWASPDGLILDADNNVVTGLEIKCPAPKKHVLNWMMVSNPQFGVPSEYLAQIHMSMVVAGVDRWHFVSFCPGFPLVSALVERDELTDKLAGLLDDSMATLMHTARSMEAALEVAA